MNAPKDLCEPLPKEETDRQASGKKSKHSATLSLKGHVHRKKSGHLVRNASAREPMQGPAEGSLKKHGNHYQQNLEGYTYLVS